MDATDPTRASVERRKAFLDVERAIAEAVAAEREACAKVCDDVSRRLDRDPDMSYGAEACADAIRARGTK